ncbi:tyrosine-type recombinase/integrase [Thioalkalivibrio nitratireducens]|uniref:tyrosine-type recombinase/integrase n=1 Tax=Thioalkalivibrio nitratireducens TaxID=186931 RepID=UPI003AAC6DDF
MRRCRQSSPLAAVISSPAHWKLAVLPRVLTVEEVEQLLSSFRFAPRWPKRGYAMVRCALDLGLRSGEIACLKIDAIDWQAGMVTLRGTKSFRQDILPLPVETGQALADYLQHERPPSASSAIFVSPQAPRGGPCTANAVRKIIMRAYRRSGIPHSGSHALRHYLPFLTMSCEARAACRSAIPLVAPPRCRALTRHSWAGSTAC